MSKIKIEFTLGYHDFEITNQQIKSIDIKKDLVKDYKFPIFGCISQSGSITINDVDKTIYNAVQDTQFTGSEQVKVYLKDTLYGTYYISQPDYDTSNYTFTFQVEDILSKFDSIELDEISMRNETNNWMNNVSLETLFNRFAENIYNNSKIQFLSYDLEMLKDITISNAYLKSGNAKQQFEKILFLCSSVAYCNENGAIEILPRYSKYTNQDYYKYNKYYYITKNKMLSPIRANVFKENRFDDIVIEGQQSISSTRSKIFDLSVDLKKMSKATAEQIAKDYSQFRDVVKSSLSYSHSGVGTSYFDYIQFYIDLDVNEKVDQFYNYDVLCTRQGDVNDNSTLSGVYNDDEIRLLVKNGVYQESNLIYLPNVKIRFAQNSSWENGSTQWHTMNFNDFAYNDGLNRSKVPVYGYIDIVRLSNNKVRLYCRFSYNFKIYITGSNSWTGKVNKLDFSFTALEQKNTTKEYWLNNKNKKYSLQAPSELLYENSFMPDFTKGYYNIRDINTGELIEKEWVGSGNLTDIIGQSILDNFKDGLMTAQFTIMAGDFTCHNTEYSLNWQNGDILKLSDKVVLTKNNLTSNLNVNSMFLDSNGEARIFEIVSINFIYEGYPKFDLQLLEIRKDWYDKGYLGNKYR